MTIMKHRIHFGLLVAALLAGTVAVSGGTVSAQDVEVSGPLAGQPPVRHLRQLRRGRLAISPFAAFTLQEPYRRTLFLGGHVDYFFTDWLGLGVWGAYGGLGFDTSLTEAIEADGVVTGRNRLSLPSRNRFSNQLGTIPGAVAAQVTLVPLRGKVALFQRGFLDTDLYLFGGAGAVWVEERANISDAECANPASGTTSDCYLASQLARQTRTIIAPTFGVGLNAYFNEWIGLSVEWRALPFKWNRSGTDESGDTAGDFPDGRVNGQDRFFQLNHMFSFGLTFYLPGHARISD